MADELNAAQVTTVTMLLQAGKTIKEIAKFASIDVGSVTKVARDLDIEPTTAARKRAKEMFGNSKGYAYQEIAKMLDAEGLRGDDGAAMHHLTVASWARSFGWKWGGSADGSYTPERAATSPARSRYVLRLSKAVEADLNSASQISAAADAAWQELATDRTRIVQLAVIRGAAAAGATDLGAIKDALMVAHGDAIRSSRS